MEFLAHEDFEDEGLAAFIESASDGWVAEHDFAEEEITARPMLLRFAAEDGDQLVTKIAEMRYHARLAIEEARAAMSPPLCALAPEDADLLRGQLLALQNLLNETFQSARALEGFAVDALRDLHGVELPAEVDAEEAALELNPPEVAPKIKITVECQTLRRQFFAVAKKMGLITRGEVRVQRLAAVAGFIGRALGSTSEMTKEEWTSVVYAVEDGRLQW